MSVSVAQAFSSCKFDSAASKDLGIAYKLEYSSAIADVGRETQRAGVLSCPPDEYTRRCGWDGRFLGCAVDSGWADNVGID